ncbi:DUF2637 domain-containing protein [Spongiactinospora sp. TRM90649]|uniref:DUF2637 domain-containing protein n=1 Tax=Spongiactinospora sp. TRM90649 TaxID=3031114 RepID=UPI0023F61F5F|nr:DUF2637 domain-containing protein [Spongiactinospora sp. TRM90649]MDF5751951.1 DUF2637 domain-containing protein [Spongiactinospora sp. TRM90649]
MNDHETINAPRPLGQGEHTAISVTAAATGVLGLLGFVISFATVATAAAPSFGWLAWIVPLGIDLGIAVFSALDIVLARLGMRLRWLRLIPWALTAATVYLNVATYLGAERVDWFAVVSHAVLPLLWVMAVEVGAHAVRKRADLAKADRMDGIRRSRWLLAPLPTLALWRRMVLWEIRSYPDALTRERDRILAKTELQDRYGRLWRTKATRRERALYRLGELVPVSTQHQVQISPVRLAPAPALPPASARKRPSRKRGKVTRHTSPDVSDLIQVGRRVAADLNARGVPLTRDRLRAAVRETGRSISTDRAGALLARLRAEPKSEAA